MTKVSGTCSRHFDVRALNRTRDRDMRKLCEKYEHVKFRVWGRAVMESDAYVHVRNRVYMIRTRKSIIDARTRREKLSLIECGIDSKDTRGCVPRISELFQPVYRAISLLTLRNCIVLFTRFC